MKFKLELFILSFLGLVVYANHPALFIAFSLLGFYNLLLGIMTIKYIKTNDSFKKQLVEINTENKNKILLRMIWVTELIAILTLSILTPVIYFKIIGLLIIAMEIIKFYLTYKLKKENAIEQKGS